jgi:hypothetical protein
MKKIFSMLAITVLGGLALSSCDNDDTTNEIATHGLAVTSATTKFDAIGGTNSITVANTPVSAYTNDDWATVAIDGNTVKVTATQNNDIQSRHASVVIKSSAEDSAVVNIDQDGMVMEIANSKTTFNDAAGEHKIHINHNLPVTVTTKADWLSASVADDSLTVTTTENTTGEPRQAWVYYSSGIITDSIRVMQFTPEKDILGDYNLYYYSNKKWHVLGVNIGKEANGSYAMHFTDEGMADYGWSVPVTIGTDKPEFTFTNLSKIGTFTDDKTYSVLWMVMAADDEYVYTSKDTEVTATASWTVDPDGTTYWSVSQNGFGSNYEFYAFRLGLSTDGKTYDKDAGTLLNLAYAQFEKVTNGNATTAKAAHIAKRRISMAKALISKNILRSPLRW